MSNELDNELDNEPFIITEDGIKIKEGEKAWYIDQINSPYNRVYLDILTFKKSDYYRYIQYYSTEEKAIDFLLKNSTHKRKVIFITDDGVEIKRYDKYFRVDKYSLKIKEITLTAPCETCLCMVRCGYKGGDYVYFSTFELCQNYVDKINNSLK